MTGFRRRAGSATVAMAVAALSALAAPTPTASATTYYEYWSYWHKPPGATSWQYSTVGASGYYLKTGKQVEGWRYAVGTASPSDPQPRPTNVRYDDYCHDTGQTYQVLLVVDYGTASSAPSGPVYGCYGFSDSTTGYAVLKKQHSERDSGGLICAIDNYPRSGCGDTVSSPAPKHTTRTAKAAPPPAAVTRPSRRSTSTTASAPRAASDATPSSKPTATASATPTPTTTSAATSSGAAPSAQPTLRPFTGAPTASKSSFPFGLVLAIAAVAALTAAAATRRRRRQ